MRSRFASDPQDPFGDLGTGESGSSFGLGVPTGLSNAGAGNTPAQPIAPILPDESFEAMAAVSGSGSGGLGSVVAETSSSGFTINLIFDAAAMAAPASFRTGIEQAASILSATITNKITVNINIDYSGTGGGAAAGPDNGQFVNYSTVRSDLIANAAPGDTSFNSLPTGSTIQGQTQVAVWNAQLKLFGLINPNDTSTDDASATFATDINPNLLVGVALHELTHAIGRVPYGAQPDIFDFYRFTSAGTRLFTDNIPASSAYFSLNGGTTKIADFGVSSDPSDFLNSGVQGANDPFNEFYTGSTLQTLTPIDKEILDAIGFNLTPGYRRCWDACTSIPGRICGRAPERSSHHQRPGKHDPIQRNDQDRQHWRHCRLRRQTLRQRRPERLAQQWRDGNLECRREHAHPERKRVYRCL